ncbi:hypothetical protein D7X99_32895 [Corallococcus sp. AB032C]|nr:hypothetical protein D7X99_32895 [Corallococcus sp. AB032C]
MLPSTFIAVGMAERDLVPEKSPPSFFAAPSARLSSGFWTDCSRFWTALEGGPSVSSWRSALNKALIDASRFAAMTSRPFTSIA